MQERALTAFLLHNNHLFASEAENLVDLAATLQHLLS
jgi:hypothetical protein